MRGNEFLDKMELVDPAYVAAADVLPKPRRHPVRRWCAAAACLCLVFCLAVPVMAASIPTAYELLYAVSPATAQFFKPVELSCEDNGIRMEVTAAYIHDDTAQIYITMQDLEDTRVDETMDLFDSYAIHTPFACTGHCDLAGYDPDTRTATFLITIQQWNTQEITGDKLTFSVREFLSGKETWQGVLADVSLEDAAENADTQTVEPRGLSGDDALAAAGTQIVLQPAGDLASPTDGVTLTGMGYVDGRLHVQVHYADILTTDNHGSLSLLHRESGQMLSCAASVAFFDEEGTGSYEDYIFPDVPADALGDYALYGEFVTSRGAVKGNWSVTFPLENTPGE